jgi:hypothetical protein
MGEPTPGATPVLVYASTVALYQKSNWLLVYPPCLIFVELTVIVTPVPERSVVGGTPIS